MNRKQQRSGIAILAVTPEGAALGAEIVAVLEAESDSEVTLHLRGPAAEAAPPDAICYDEPLAARVAGLFPDAEALIFILELSATVRLVAPLLARRQADPTVVCLDDGGQFVIPVLSARQRDADALASLVADAVAGVAVVSDATLAANAPNLERTGAEAGWRLDVGPETLQKATAILQGGANPLVYVLPDLHGGGAFPASWPRVESLEALRGWDGARVAVTDQLIDPGIETDGGPLVVYRPRTLVLGVGCRTDASPEEVVALAGAALEEAGLAWGSVHTVATIESHVMHPALVKLVWETDAQFFPVFTAEELAAVTGLPSPSAEVERHVGTRGVSEPAAILASYGGELILPKRASANATVAVARRRMVTAQPGASSDDEETP